MSSSKDVQEYAETALVTIHAIKLVITGNPVNSCLTSTLYKTHHGPVIAPFSVQILKCLLLFLLATLEVPY